MATAIPFPSPQRVWPIRASRRRTRGWYVAVAVAAVAVGALAAVQPMLAVAAVIAPALVAIVLARPLFGLAAVLSLSFLEAYSVIGGVGSATKLVGGVVVLAWLAFVATAARDEQAGRGLISSVPALAAVLVLFLAWTSISLVWAEEPASGATVLQRLALNFVLFPVALVALRVPRQVKILVAVFVVGTFIAAVIGLLTGSLEEAAEGERLKGGGLNPNQLGSYLVVASVLLAACAANRRWSASARTAALALAVLAIVAVFFTLSRGALVGLAAAMVVAPFVIGRGRRVGAILLAVGAIAVTVGWFAAIAPDHAAERITNPGQGGGAGREDLWRVAWRMVDDNPIHGVGIGNFPVSSIHYLLRPGATQRDSFIIDDRKVPHNIYLAVLSELGVVGLTLFLLILAISLRCALRAARAFAARGDPTMELIARGLFIALVSILTSFFFSSALVSKQLWLLVAMAPALQVIAERGDVRARARAGDGASRFRVRRPPARAYEPAR